MSKPLHPEDIKAGIRKKYKSLANFERQHGLPGESATDVLRGKSVSRTAEAIADFLGVDVKTISPNQKWVKTRTSRDTKSGSADCHRLNAGAK